MIQNIPTTMINYIDANGNLTQNPAIKTVMIRSQDDLTLIKKPTPGDRAYLADESKVWTFDANGEWSEVVIETSGGGSSSDDDNVFVVTFTHDDGALVCDRTINEILTAKTAGKLILGQIEEASLVFDGNEYFYAQFVDIGNNLLKVDFIFWDVELDKWNSTAWNYALTWG